MGFHVEISDSDDRFLKRLAHKPSAIFPEPYNGYLLFLVGEADRAALDWLQHRLREPALRHKVLVKTISVLEYYASSIQWPLPEEWTVRYRHVFDAYVCKLLDSAVVCDPKSVDHCRDVVALLDTARREVVAVIDQAIPSASGIRTTIQDGLRRRNENAIRNCEAEIAGNEAYMSRLPMILAVERAEADSRLAVWARGKSGRLPSFTAHFRHAIRNHQLERYASATRSGILEFFANLFKPDLLLRIAEWMVKAAS